MKRFLPWTLAFSLTLLAVWAVPALGAPASMIGPRAMAMGGAFTAVANDGTAPYFNPAGLSQLPWTITIGTGLQAAPTAMVAAASTAFGIDWTGPFDVTLLQAVGNAMQTDLSGLPLNLAFDPYFGVAGPWAGLAVAAQARANMGTLPVPNGTGFIPVGQMTATGTGYVSTAVKFKQVLPGIDWCSVGFNAKAFYAVEVTAALDVSLYSYSISKGWGYAGDVGILMPLGKSMRLGLTARDLLWTINGGTSTQTTDFGSSITTPAATTPWQLSKPVTVNAGLAYMPPGTGMTLAADLQGFTLSSQSLQSPTSVHLGFEQVYSGAALRFGAVLEQDSQGLLVTYAGGLGLGSKAFQFDVGLSYNRTDRLCGVGTLSLKF